MLLVLLQRPDLLLLRLQLARNRSQRLLAPGLLGLQLAAPAALLALERGEPVATGLDLLGTTPGLVEVGAQAVDQREPRASQVLEVMRITRELIGVLRREQRRHAVRTAVHVVPPQPLGKLAAARIDAQAGLALLGLEQCELLLGVAALGLEPGQFAHHAGHRALGLGERFRRAGPGGLGAGHLLLQVADALLEIVEVGAPLRDVAPGLSESHVGCRATEKRGGQDKRRSGVSMQHAAQRPRVPQHSSLRRAAGAGVMARIRQPRASRFDARFPITG